VAERVSLKALGLGQALSGQFITFRMRPNAAIAAIGCIIGLKYAAILAAGSFFSCLVLVPVVRAVLTQPGGRLAALAALS
jgi:uncharacterized oligopeptide transporter (OPT) family protein